jgi:hypothetical protein
MKYDIVGTIMEYEEGDLDLAATLELFQHLVNDGTAWSLQGHYGRTAAALLDGGWITPAGEPDPDFEVTAEQMRD